MALRGFDDNCQEYIEFVSNLPEKTEAKPQNSNKNIIVAEGLSALKTAVVKGMKDEAFNITDELIKISEPLDIINNEIIPALDIVGTGYENKTMYLPQLLMSAEAAKSAFECIKSKMKTDDISSNKCSFVLATVHGDIHDIGKNIVRLILENYGFKVYDLGKDVPPEKIVSEVLRLEAPIVGLSALMTTTVPAMEKTIKLIKEKSPNTKVIVGGAVLTEEYANSIGADKYAKDAMEAVRYAETLY
jgi:5-methyltetrahydrofolate--homocysteine methyltransferase